MCECVCLCVHSAHSWRLIESQLPLLQGQCCVLCALCKSRGHCGAVFVLSNAKCASVKWWARQQKEKSETPYTLISFCIFKSSVNSLSLFLSWLWEVLQLFSLARFCLSLSLSLIHSFSFLFLCFLFLSVILLFSYFSIFLTVSLSLYACLCFCYPLSLSSSLRSTLVFTSFPLFFPTSFSISLSST